MPTQLAFIEATPQDVASRLDGQTVHLWRIPYALSEGRAPLVALLAGYLGVSEGSVRLDQDERGKPRLARDSSRTGDASRLEFNWSHSGDFALVALARGCELGVDIERFGKNQRSLEIARRFFDSEEADALAPLDTDTRDRAFIKLWCAKEAVLKAVGEGLSFGLARLAFTRRVDTDWILTRVDPMLGDVNDWQLTGFEAASDYRGALAWRGDPRAITAFRSIDSIC